MKLCAIFLRALSKKITPARSSPAAVAPWPALKNPFDAWLAGKLETLLCHDQYCSYASARWLTRALETAVATQKMTIESILKNVIVYQDSDRKAIDDYLEDVVELLDSCNRLRDRMESIQEYINSLKTVLHCLEGKKTIWVDIPSETVLGRARAALDSCGIMERRCAVLDKCSSGLRKLAEKIISQGAALPTCGSKTCSLIESSSSTPSSELQRILSGSKAIAILTCGVFDIALSFKSKRGLPATTSWLSSLNELHKELKEEIEKRRRWSSVVFAELREAVNASKNLRVLINSRWIENKSRRVELRTCVQDLRRSCDELEEGMRPFVGRINELYKDLISIRVALLDMLSQA